MKINHLICGAFAPELEPFEQFSSKTPGVQLFETGVGTVKAAISMSAQLAQAEKPDFVLFVGSIGTVDTSVPLLTTVVVNEVFLAQDELNSFFPETQTTHIGSEVDFGLTLPKVSVYSPAAISNSETSASRMARATNAKYENLELFGIALACNENKVPWASVNTVTNYVCPEGHDQWDENHRNAASQTAKVLLPALDNHSS